MATLADFGLDADAFAELGPRSFAGRLNGHACVVKLADDALSVDGLRHEAEVLTALRLPVMPRVIDRIERKGALALVTGFREGRVPATAAPGLRAALEPALGALHAAGWVHCDLKPGNLLLGDDGALTVLDWEAAARNGADIASLPRRQCTPGWSHPDLIWGRGRIRPELDLFSLNLLVERLDPGTAEIPTG